MATYFLIEVMQIKDKVLYQRYADAARMVIEHHSGQYLIRSNDVRLFAGTARPERVVLIRFPNERLMDKCFKSPAYRKLAPFREQSVESRAFVINEE